MRRGKQKSADPPAFNGQIGDPAEVGYVLSDESYAMNQSGSGDQDICVTDEAASMAKLGVDIGCLANDSSVSGRTRL